MISTDSLDFYYESLPVNGLLKSRFSWFSYLNDAGQQKFSRRKDCFAVFLLARQCHPTNELLRTTFTTDEVLLYSLKPKRFQPLCKNKSKQLIRLLFSYMSMTFLHNYSFLQKKVFFAAV